MKDVLGHTNLNTKKIYLNIDFDTLKHFALEVPDEEKIDYVFPEQYRIIAEEYISYKRSMGSSFGYDDLKTCDQLLHYLYNNSLSKNVTDLTKKLVEGYLAQFHSSEPRTIHVNQSYIRQYGLFLKQMGYVPYIYPATLIQCPKDFTPLYFLKTRNLQDI